jgi:hypothetical protein
MKKVLFLLVVLFAITLTTSASTTETTDRKPKKGYNYKAHKKRGNKVFNKTQRRNKGKDMLHHQCTNRH